MSLEYEPNQFVLHQRRVIFDYLFIYDGDDTSIEDLMCLEMGFL